MSGGIYDFIPGLSEAEARYKDGQLEAFTGIEPAICGIILINPFTPQMFLELDGCENAFLRDAAPDAADIGAFLWRTSPQYRRDDMERRKVFLALICPLDFESVARDIYQYLRRAWAGMPAWKTSSRKRQSAGIWVSRLVHIFASQYGWTEEYILNLPFRRLWQYVNRIMEDNNERYSEACPEVQRLQAEWLIKENQRLTGAN